MFWDKCNDLSHAGYLLYNAHLYWIHWGYKQTENFSNAVAGPWSWLVLSDVKSMSACCSCSSSEFSLPSCCSLAWEPGVSAMRDVVAALIFADTGSSEAEHISQTPWCSQPGTQTAVEQHLHIGLRLNIDTDSKVPFVLVGWQTVTSGNTCTIALCIHKHTHIHRSLEYQHFHLFQLCVKSNGSIVVMRQLCQSTELCHGKEEHHKIAVGRSL